MVAPVLLPYLRQILVVEGVSGLWGVGSAVDRSFREVRRPAVPLTEVGLQPGQRFTGQLSLDGFSFDGPTAARLLVVPGNSVSESARLEGQHFAIELALEGGGRNGERIEEDDELLAFRLVGEDASCDL